jgi:3'-phosphoadenosine 5'-phosphosulfate sulfotransferase (PAPS reductase)/FAD synthetase
MPSVPELQMLPLLDDTPLALPRDPSLVVVSISGGKDSTAALIAALETFGPGAVVAHHQIILEDWLQTPDYCQMVCDYLGVPLYLSQGVYNGFLCLKCGHRHLSMFYEEAYCHKCGSYDKQLLGVIDSIHDLIRWREKWVDARVRACTGHFKIEVFNTWARNNVSLLGRRPVMVLGERHLESRGRMKLPDLRYRDLRKGWMLEWRPILHYRRIDAFRASRQWGIEPHPCYKLQWRGILRRQHLRWLQEGIPPRASYPGQWEGLDQVEELSIQVLDAMIDTQMYEVDCEGGPRCSCRDCFFKEEEEMRATYDTDQGKALIDDGIAIERETGFTMKYGQSLESVVGDKESNL